MKNYEFKLNPAYCLSNGIAVLEQKGSSIKFLVNDLSNELLQSKLRNAFCNYLDYVKNQDDCNISFLKIPHVEFVGANKTLLKNYVMS